MGQCELLLPMQCVRGKVGEVMSDFSEIQVNLWQGGSGESEWDGKKFSEVIDLIRSQRGEYALSNRQFYEYLEGWGKR